MGYPSDDDDTAKDVLVSCGATDTIPKLSKVGQEMLNLIIHRDNFSITCHWLEDFEWCSINMCHLNGRGGGRIE